MVRLSIIVPGYDTPREWWRRCLKSVLTAMRSNDEVIVADDGSHVPVSREWLCIDDPRLQIVRLPTNRGQAAARNAAIGVARGEWITFVDSDDEILPDIYDVCFKRLGADAFDVALYGVRVVWTYERLFKDDIPPDEKPGVLTPVQVNQLLWSCLLEYPVNKVYRRAFLKDHKILFDEGISPGEDTIFNFKCLLARAHWCFVPQVGYVYYRMDNTSLSQFLPNYRESLKRRSDIAHAYKTSEPTGFEVMGGVFERSEKELDLLTWENAWRRGTSFSLMSRWKMRPGWPFIKKLILYVARRYFYVKPIRRHKIIKAFPLVQDMRRGGGRACYGSTSPRALRSCWFASRIRE